MKLVAYVRTSTRTGAEGDSPEAQADYCREWASVNGHTVIDVLRDDAIGGGLGIEDRPGLAAALVKVEQGCCDGIVVHRLDRLARELHVQEVALAHAWSIGEHVEVFDVSEGGPIKRDDPNDPHRRFLRQVMGAAAELERGLIRARLSGGRKRKAKRGGYIGGKRLHTRYGYDLIDGEYVPNDDHDVVRRIVRMRDEGSTYQGIVDALAVDRVTPPSGAAWYPASVRNIVLREQKAAALA